MKYWFDIGYAHLSIVWKYVFLLHVLNKNESNSRKNLVPHGRRLNNRGLLIKPSK